MVVDIELHIARLLVWSRPTISMRLLIASFPSSTTYTTLTSPPTIAKQPLSSDHSSHSQSTFMHPALHRLATASPSKLRAPPLSLERFLLRARVLSLYRTILRALYAVPDRDLRRDPIAHVKSEFARNRHVQDESQIRYLASTGKAEWDGMRRYVEELQLRARPDQGRG